MTKTKVVVVLSALNEEKWISRLLYSLFNQTIPPIKIVIVNDGSTDGTKYLLDSWRGCEPEVIEIIDRDDRIDGPNLAGTPEMALAFNLGFALIENLGIDYDYLMISGADCEYPPTYIKDVIRNMEEDPLIVMASGKKKSYPFFYDDCPVGAGRLIRKDFWVEYGQRYDYPSYMWENTCVRKAKMKGYKTKQFYDVQFETRDRGMVMGHYKNGVSHRAIKYRKISVMIYIWRKFKHFQWRDAFEYLRGYLRKPTRIIESDRKFLEEFRRWYLNSKEK